MKRILLSVFLVLSLPACSLFQASPTPSNQVLAEINLAETALLTTETILNIRAHDSGKAVDKSTQEAEALVYAYLEAARTAAVAGDNVTAEQKLGLFNQALRNFNQQYVSNAATQPQ